MEPYSTDPLQQMSRRYFFGRLGVNVGAIALWSLFQRDGIAAPASASSNSLLSPQPPHFAPKAKNVILLNMAGAPPQLDMFDYKPKLNELSGEPVPESLTEGERFAFISGDAKLAGSPYNFAQYGKNGIWMSEVTQPHMGEIADDICIVRSAHTDEFNHVPAALLFFTGFRRTGRPSIGAWVNYGLGSTADNLPGFVVMSSGRGARCGAACHGNGFLPSIYQGVKLRSRGDPVLYLNNPKGMDRKLRRDTLDALQELNQSEHELYGDPEIETRISQYEMAFQMQASVPELADISTEPASIQQMYGTEPGKKSFSNNCLLARRLVERGVRFIQLNHGEWDLHGGNRVNIPRDLPRLCNETMQGASALIKDLKQRGLLDETLVVWASEFGRTPMLQGSLGDQFGRDHHKTFTVWMAGGGVKPGITYGNTDELGYNPVENPVHVHDLQATLLHLLGFDHTRLTYHFQGRDFRLTDVHGNVVHPILA